MSPDGLATTVSQPRTTHGPSTPSTPSAPMLPHTSEAFDFALKET
eukprot:CAMPEP_0182456614 /NCGR_PEP_ID=MMETSP1319-20130603/2398_1 /TAXON_ID=172717 /ORGANISM="Bolidomonas pacifica, Strain RCC208" /LENGTH=44 /DNA_ID= /DNA_START= /DNA_END= /DNA_ORIENTATION=